MMTDRQTGKMHSAIKEETATGAGSESRRDKRMKVSWTLTKKLDTFAGPGEIKRREVGLDPQVSPEEIKSREVGLGSKSWTSFASVATQQQCYGHCPCDSAPHSRSKQQLCGAYASCYAMARGHRLNISIVLAAIHGLHGLPGGCARSSLHSFAPTPVTIPNKPPRLCRHTAKCLLRLRASFGGRARSPEDDDPTDRLEKCLLQ